MPTDTKCALLGGTTEMEETDVAAKENFRDNEDLALSLSMVRGLAEDNHLVFSASELKGILQRIREEHTKASDVTQQQSHQKLIQEWYLQNQWGRKISIPYSNFLSLNENVGRHCLGVVELRASESLSIICKTPAAFNIPLNLRSSKREYLFDRLKLYKRRTQSTTDLCTFVTGYASQGVPGNVALSPIGQWMVDAIEGRDKAKNLLKSHLSSLVTDMSLGRLKSVDGLRVTKGLNQIHCPPKLNMSSSQKPHPGKRRYGSEIPNKMLASCMSLKSTSSCQSSSFSRGVASQGVLYCIWKSRKPHFEFSVDDRGEVYVANLLEVESQDDSAPDYLYMFHSKSNCSKEQVRYGNMSDLIGKMKVSSRLTLDSNNQKHVETEFVLFASGERHVGVSSATASRKHKLLPQKMVDMFKASNSTKYKPAPRFDDFSRDTYLELSGEIHNLGEESLCENHVPPNLELAAIVMKDSLGEGCLEEAVGGWGLKFLKRDTAAKCHESNLGEQNEPFLSVNVLVPAGFHGGPATRNGGPSSLTERWRSGGHCDCGGWDVGCPLTVLNNSSNDSCTSLERGRQEDCKSFDLYTEGSKEGQPTLKMVNAHQGLYFVHFESSLTALQSFAISVAFIHRQSPALRSKLFPR